MTEFLKIIKLKSENIKKLVAVEITPTGDLVRITGANGQGKSSVLDSILWALAGEKAIQDVPIRQGQEKALIELDLGDKIVRRTFTPHSTQLTIENKEGLRFPSPQRMLDDLIGKLSFDPLAFLRLEPKKQLQTLKDLTGVSTDDLDAQRQKLYDERTVKNREVDSAQARYVAVTVPENAPEQEVDSAEIAQRLTAAMEQNRKNQAARDALQALKTAEVNAAPETARLVNELAALNERIAAHNRKLDDLRQRIVNGEAHCAALQDVDTTSIQTELSGVEIANRSARARAEKVRLKNEHEAAKQLSEQLTAQLDKIDQEKKDRIAAAAFPVPDLAFGDGAVTYQGLPLEQASQAEQLRVSLAVAMALNPKLRVLRITDGSLLDSKSLELIRELCHTNQYQCWIEEVDETGKVGIVIEAGQVAAVNGEAA